MNWPRKKTILGCDARGDGDSVYLTRWIFIRCRWFHLYLHRFHRSDADDRHDHPWAFVSLILWHGYYESTPAGTRFKWPGMLLFRPARWIHRVVLDRGKPAWSLVLTGPYVREWGFYTPSGWQQWQDYFREKGC